MSLTLTSVDPRNAFDRWKWNIQSAADHHQASPVCVHFQLPRLLKVTPRSKNKDPPTLKWNLSPSLPYTNIPRLPWTVYLKSRLSPQSDDPKKLQFDVPVVLVYCQIKLGDERVSVFRLVQS